MPEKKKPMKVVGERSERKVREKAARVAEAQLNAEVNRPVPSDPAKSAASWRMSDNHDSTPTPKYDPADHEP